MPITIQIADGVAFQPAVFLLVDDMPPEGSLAVVFEPKKRRLARVLAHDVHVGEVEVSVAVDIMGSNAKRVSILIRDETLGEANWEGFIVADRKAAPHENRHAT